MNGRDTEGVNHDECAATNWFNALRHGVLPRHTVLPWEDQKEYQALLDGLAAEHTPSGPTEEHLVEELAGIIWRKRRPRLAEAAIYREQLRKDAVATYEPDNIAGAALLPTTSNSNQTQTLLSWILSGRQHTAADTSPC